MIHIDEEAFAMQNFIPSLSSFEQIHLVYRQDCAGVLRVDLRTEYPLLNRLHRAGCALWTVDTRTLRTNFSEYRG